MDINEYGKKYDVDPEIIRLAHMCAVFKGIGRVHKVGSHGLDEELAKHGIKQVIKSWSREGKVRVELEFDDCEVSVTWQLDNIQVVSD